MKKITSTVSILLLSAFSNNLIAQNKSWTKVIREYKTIDNVTYFFPSEVDISRRDAAIEECQSAIVDNLKIIQENEFKNEIDVEFVKSRKEMLKFTGMGAQGMALPDRDTFFTLLKDKGSPIKHEMMHMLSMYKWGTPPVSSTWMNEGLATYSGGTCFKYSLEEIYKYFIQSKKLISINKLSDDFYTNPDMIAYTQSALISKYLIDNYGIEKFKKLWKGGFDKLEEIYGFNSQSLEHSLNDYINRKYPKDIDFDWEEFNKGC